MAGTDSIFGKLKFQQFHNGRSRLKFSLYHHKIHRILHCRIVLYSFYISNKMYQLRCMSNHIERVVCLLTFVQLLRKVQKIFHGTTVLYSFYISNKMYQLTCMSNHIERVVCLPTFVQLLRENSQNFPWYNCTLLVLHF